jgi:hypothetical protein
LVTERKKLLNDADVYEIFCQAELVAKEDEDKAANGLRVFNDRNGAVSKILQWVFDDNIKSTLPEGPTPFNKNEAPASDLTETSLRFEFKLFKYFVTEEVPQVRRETMWIELLEGIPTMEAKLIDLVKDGVWPFKNITKSVAEKAFPNITFN